MGGRLSGGEKQRLCIARALIKDADKKLDVRQIEENLQKAGQFFIMVQVDKHPVVPESLLTDLELLSAIKRMKRGLKLCEEAKRELQRRFI